MSEPRRSFRSWLFVVAAAGLAPAQQDPLLPPPNGPRTEAPTRTVLTGALVRATPDAAEAEAVVVLDAGRIAAVIAPADYDPATAAGARVVDLKGLRIYAGFVDPFVEVETPAPKADRPGAHWNPRVTPDRRVSDGAGLDARLAGDLRKIGVCVAGLAPSGGLFRGTGAAVATSPPAAEPSARRPRVLLPESCHVVALQAGAFTGPAAPPAEGFRQRGANDNAWSNYPGSLMGAISLVRQTLFDASTPRDGASCLSALRLDAPWWFDVDNELDLLRAAKVAEEFGLAGTNAVVFVGSGREYRRLEAVARALKAPAEYVRGLVIPLEFPEAPTVATVGDQEAVELTELMAWEQAPTNARRLAKAGVRFAFTSSKSRDRGGLLDGVRKAIKAGLDERTALAALTTEPALLLGLGDELGVVAPGRAANLVVTDGPLFEEKTKIRDVWIDGERHEATPPPGRDAGGTWEMDVPAEATVARSFVVDADKNVKVRAGDKTADAKNAAFVDDRASFSVDQAALGGKGVATFTALVEGDVLSGVVLGADGGAFRFTARRTGPASRAESRAESAPASRESDAPDSRPEGEAAESEPAAREGGGRRFGGRRGERGGERGGDGAAESRPQAEEPPPETLPLPFGPYGLLEPAKRPSVVHVVGGTVWTSGPAGVIADGYVVVKDGLVAEVGKGRPSGTADVVVDATGLHVTPGIVDCHSHTGISGGVNEGGQAVTAEVRIEDVTDPDDVDWYRQLAGGVTTVNSLHGSANAIGGQNCVNKLRWGAVAADDMHLEGAPPGIKFALGENPRGASGPGGSRYPQTRMGVETLIRDRFFAARAYAAARFLDPEGVRVDLELEALAEVLSGKRLVHCHSYRQDEILMLCRTAAEFGFKIGTFQHVLEGYKVADEIAAQALGASSFADWWAYKVEVWDAIPHNGSLMRDRGVVVSFNSDSDEMARRMNVEAAKAVKHGGTPEAEALKFVTLNPAMQLKIDARVGSLEPGKDADFAVWSGPPLATTSRCVETWVDGIRRFSLAEDAAHRERIRSERSRLIQKILGGGAGPPEAGGGRGFRGGRRGGRPGDAAEESAPRRTRIERLRALFERGDAEGMRQGDCGCEELNREASHDR